MPRKQTPAPAPVRQEVQKQEVYSGPLPHPDLLKKFKESDPSFPERIMRMTEANVAADVKAKNRTSLANLVTPIMGQTFSFLLGLSGIAASLYLGTRGLTPEAIAAIVGGFSPLIISAISKMRK